MESFPNERAAVLFLVASGMMPPDIAKVLDSRAEKVDQIISALCAEFNVSGFTELMMCLHSTEQKRADAEAEPRTGTHGS